MLLPMALVLDYQCGQSAIVLGRKSAVEARGRPGLHRGVVFCLTLTNEVEQ